MNVLKFTIIQSIFICNLLFAQFSISITTPNGGELLRQGSSFNIQWTNTGTINKVKLKFFNGTVWEVIPGADSIPNVGSYSWNIPDNPTTLAKIRISDATNDSIYDSSNAVFRIISPGILPSQVNIMPLGNSITFDRFSANPRVDGDCIGYRYPLWVLLRNNNLDFNFVGTQTAGFNIFPDPENEGHPGWTDNQVAANIYSWLQANPNTDIILLHIGTNNVDTARVDVQNILNEIDRFEQDSGKQVWVIIARIINRWIYAPASERTTTTIFNDHIEELANSRINNGDKLLLVDMENDAGFNYDSSTVFPYSNGDLWDNVHPNQSGYNKMANIWFSALQYLLPAPAPSLPIIYSTPIINAIVSQQYIYDVNASGVGAPSYYLSAAPAGMNINQNTGKITWVPESAGNFNVIIEARNSSAPSTHT